MGEACWWMEKTVAHLARSGLCRRAGADLAFQGGQLGLAGGRPLHAGQKLLPGVLIRRASCPTTPCVPLVAVAMAPLAALNPGAPRASIIGTCSSRSRVSGTTGVNQVPHRRPCRPARCAQKKMPLRCAPRKKVHVCPRSLCCRIRCANASSFGAHWSAGCSGQRAAAAGMLCTLCTLTGCSAASEALVRMTAVS